MNEEINFKRTRFACFSAYFTMSSIFSFPPLLFMTFKELYNISYTQLGSLVLINFVTQLGIDLIFTAFSKYFNIHKTVKIMPVITTVGLLIYALIPTFFSQFAYLGLLLGTVLFSVSAGLSEVLLSPTIAAMPSDNPSRDMSFLHSLYAFGVFTVVVVSTVFLKILGSENWMFLCVFWALLPLIPAILFATSPMPDMSGDGNASDNTHKNKLLGIALLVGCIFFGSCAENVMSNWVSSFAENALGINKTAGDILGMAMFAILLGIARISYSRFGKNISRVLLIGMAGAFICYLLAALTGRYTAFIACALTGLFTSMLWPGALILMEEKIEGASVTAFALMAAGGDMGAALAPQLMGIIIDKVSLTNWAYTLGEKLNLTAEQIGLKTGMLVSSIFPLIGVFVLIFTIRYFKKKD